METHCFRAKRGNRFLFNLLSLASKGCFFLELMDDKMSWGIPRCYVLGTLAIMSWVPRPVMLSSLLGRAACKQPVSLSSLAGRHANMRGELFVNAEIAHAVRLKSCHVSCGGLRRFGLEVRHDWLRSVGK